MQYTFDNYIFSIYLDQEGWTGRKLRKTGMRTEIVQDTEPVQLVRDDGYFSDFNGFCRTGLHETASLIREMEIDILLSAGFPVGSYVAMRGLIEIEAVAWERVLSLMEIKEAGTARKALEFVERLRIYERSGIAIIYMVVHNGRVCTIYLGALSIVDQSAPDLEGKIPDLLWKMIHLRP
jgi:hypothetical protein